MDDETAVSSLPGEDSDTHGGDSDAEANTSAEELADKVKSLALYCSSSSSSSSVSSMDTSSDDIYYDASATNDDVYFDAIDSFDDDSLFIGFSYSHSTSYASWLQEELSPVYTCLLAPFIVLWHLCCHLAWFTSAIFWDTLEPFFFDALSLSSDLDDQFFDAEGGILPFLTNLPVCMARNFTAVKPVNLGVLSPENMNLTNLQKDLLCWRYHFGHLSMQRLKDLLCRVPFSGLEIQAVS